MHIGKMTPSMTPQDVKKWDHRGPCACCGYKTDWTCQTCQFEHDKKVWLCTQKKCRDRHNCSEQVTLVENV
jgi:hypothetical protein